MALAGEVGLQLVLSRLNSNVVLRTACCSVGIALPVYSTFKAIEKKDLNEQQKWLVYWAAFGAFSLAEVCSDKILYWFPLYYHMKFAFLVWLQLPFTDGAKHLYRNHIRPFLLKRQARLDQILNFLHGEMNKFVIAHQAEFRVAKAVALKILASGMQLAQDLILPDQKQASHAIDGPSRQVKDSESDDETDNN